MSRIGRKPIELPKGLAVKITAEAVEVQGPKGKLTTPIPRGIRFQREDGRLVALPERSASVQSQSELLRVLSGEEKATWGMARALVANAVKGVTEGFRKELEIVGVGYRAEVKGNTVLFSLGYSKPVEFSIPEEIEIKVERQRVSVSGIDKQKVDQVAAKIRALRPPDPYKQKGIRYVGEALRKKAGKAATTVAK